MDEKKAEYWDFFVPFILQYTREKERIRRLQDSINEAHGRQRKIQESFDAERLRLINEYLRQNDQSWCTECEKLFKKSDLTLVFCRGIRIVTVGSDYSRGDEAENFAELHRLCPACADHQLSLHGWVGEYKDHLGVTPRLHAFKATEQVESIIIRAFGTEEILDLAKMNDLRTKMRYKIENDFAEEIGLPPQANTVSFTHEDPFDRIQKFYSE